MREITLLELPQSSTPIWSLHNQKNHDHVIYELLKWHDVLQAVQKLWFPKWWWLGFCVLHSDHFSGYFRVDNRFYTLFHFIYKFETHTNIHTNWSRIEAAHWKCATQQTNHPIKSAIITFSQQTIDGSFDSLQLQLDWDSLYAAIQYWIWNIMARDGNSFLS